MRVPIGDALSVAVTDMARNAVLSQVAAQRLPFSPPSVAGLVLISTVTGWSVALYLLQVVPVTYETQQLQRQEADGGPGHAVQEVVFLADLEPLAFSFFAVRPTDAGDPGAAVPSEVGLFGLF